MRLPVVFSLFPLVVGCSETGTEVLPSAPEGALSISTPAAAEWLAEGEVVVEGTVTAIDAVALMAERPPFLVGSGREPLRWSGESTCLRRLA